MCFRHNEWHLYTFNVLYPAYISFICFSQSTISLGGIMGCDVIVALIDYRMPYALYEEGSTVDSKLYWYFVNIRNRTSPLVANISYWLVGDVLDYIFAY